jgi:hypothetical protein
MSRLDRIPLNTLIKVDKLCRHCIQRGLYSLTYTAIKGGVRPIKLGPDKRGPTPAIYPWWNLRDSNPQPPGCKPGALPVELRPPNVGFSVEPPTPLSAQTITLTTDVLKAR